MKFELLSLVDLLNGIGSSEDSSRVVDEEFLLPEVEENEAGEVVLEPTVVAVRVGC